MSTSYNDLKAAIIVILLLAAIGLSVHACNRLMQTNRQHAQREDSSSTPCVYIQVARNGTGFPGEILRASHPQNLPVARPDPRRTSASPSYATVDQVDSVEKKIWQKEYPKGQIRIEIIHDSQQPGTTRLVIEAELDICIVIIKQENLVGDIVEVERLDLPPGAHEYQIRLREDFDIDTFDPLIPAQ